MPISDTKIRGESHFPTIKKGKKGHMGPFVLTGYPGGADPEKDDSKKQKAQIITLNLGPTKWQTWDQIEIFVLTRLWWSLCPNLYAFSSFNVLR